MRIFAIGDIHGFLTPLERLDQELNFSPEDTLVVLGDVIDKGPDTCGVIQKLLQLSARTQLVCLCGNHEAMLLRAEKERNAVSPWLSYGGEATMDSYQAKNLSHIPELHWDFIDLMKNYYETETEIFVHAGLAHDRRLSNQSDEILFWRFFETPLPHMSGKRMICGHTPQFSGLPLNLGYAVCIDTAITDGGWLTCLEVATNEYWQANAKGAIRSNSLETT